MSGAPPPAHPEALDEIYAHARAGYPEEVCGIVFGAEGAAERGARRARTGRTRCTPRTRCTFTRDARTAYNLGANDLFFLGKSLRGAGPARSSTTRTSTSAPYFSDNDQAAAPRTASCSTPSTTSSSTSAATASAARSCSPGTPRGPLPRDRPLPRPRAGGPVPLGVASTPRPREDYGP